MPELAEMLSRRIGHPVRDLTGLAGAYKVTLAWTGEDKMQKPGKDKPASNKAGDKDRPTLFTALPQQLGLKLEARKMPVELFVIDRIERTPTGN